MVDLTIVPGDISLTTTAEEAAEQSFSVTATYENGAEQENFPLVSWSLSNTAIGEVDAATGAFVSSTSAGGVTLLTAESDGLIADTTITVIYEEEYEEDGVPAGTSFKHAKEVGTLTWAYPEDGVALPKNLPEFTFMWKDTGQADAYRLKFSSSTTSVTVLTTEREWTAPTELWKVITATNAGGDVTVSLYADRGDSAAKASSIGFRVNRFDAQGAVYYWSVARSGIMRSEVDAAEPEVWFGPLNGTTDDCVGCHVLSPDGDQVSYAWQKDGESSFRMGLGDVSAESEASVALPMDSTRDRGYFSSWSPDGDQIVFSGEGGLNFYDNAGNYLYTLDSSLDLTQPSWSPDGDHLAAVSATEWYLNEGEFMGGAIVVFEKQPDGTFGGDPTTLVERAHPVNQYYPMYSPDGDWLVFNRSTNTSNFNEDATLWLVAATGGEPIELVAANQGPNLTNSWARWGPIPDDDVLWLAFASTRDYGTASTDRDAHVWVSAINTSLAELGEDPSAAAFWLVQQEVGGKNHAPWWSLY